MGSVFIRKSRKRKRCEVLLCAVWNFSLANFVNCLRKEPGELISPATKINFKVTSYFLPRKPRGESWPNVSLLFFIKLMSFQHNYFSISFTSAKHNLFSITSFNWSTIFWSQYYFTTVILKLRSSSLLQQCLNGRVSDAQKRMGMGFRDRKLRRLRKFRFLGRAKVFLMVRWPMLVCIKTIVSRVKVRAWNKQLTKGPCKNKSTMIFGYARFPSC